MSTCSRYQTAVRVTLLSSGVNLLLALVKIVVGSLSFSHALVADGVHSFADLATDLLVLIAAKIGNKLPDQDHPYGHQRFETIGVIFVALILIGAAVGISYDAWEHLHNLAKMPHPGIATLIIAVISIVANECLYRYAFAVGKKIHSTLVESNAWHHRVDSLSSLVVLVSIAGSLLGFPYLDAVGAIIISIWIFKISMVMILNAAKELIDTGVDEDTLKKIRTYMCNIPGVIAIHQLRTRSHGSNILVDAHIQVKPYISVSEGHYISEKVHLGLKKHFTNVSDVIVHIDPEDDTLNQPSQQLPNRYEFLKLFESHCSNLLGYSQIKTITLHYLDGKLQIVLLMPLSILAQASAQDLATIYTSALNGVEEIKSLVINFG